MRDRGANAVFSALQLRAMFSAAFHPEAMLTGAEAGLHQKRAVLIPPAACGLAVVVADLGNSDRSGFNSHGCTSKRKWSALPDPSHPMQVR